MNLFNDVEDKELRNYNRGTTLVNLYEQHAGESRVNARGVAAILAYFKEVPAEDRAAVLEEFRTVAMERGHLPERLLN